MANWVVYELWNGKKVVGIVTSSHKLFGSYVIIPLYTELKRPYNKKEEQVRLPIIQRVVFHSATDIHFRAVLDVRRKSSRQLAKLQGRHI